MDLWRSLNGMVQVEIVSAAPTRLLTELYDNGITLEHVRFPDELTVRFHVSRQNVKAVRRISGKCGAQMKLIAKNGLYWRFRSFAHRPVLIIGFTLLLLLTAFIPTRICFFRVVGNDRIPARLILETASECGISFGASRRDVRSEKVKNSLLEAIPDLEWAGINTAGCVAIISVRERQNGEKNTHSQMISSIVASRDGVIQELTVTAGSAVVKQGQAVKAGQVLISGYTDCGLSIRAERASGEIYANTNRSFSFLIPNKCIQRGLKTVETKKYSVIIGKKRINFYQGSGILDTSCVKMYEEDYLTLPGGFRLPIAIVTETYICYEESTSISTAEQVRDDLALFAGAYLRRQMVAGKIVTKEESFSNENGVFRLFGEYGCVEMIGRERSEEIITP